MSTDKTKSESDCGAGKYFNALPRTNHNHHSTDYHPCITTVMQKELLVQQLLQQRTRAIRSLGRSTMNLNPTRISLQRTPPV